MLNKALRVSKFISRFEWVTKSRRTCHPVCQRNEAKPIYGVRIWETQYLHIWSQQWTFFQRFFSILFSSQKTCFSCFFFYVLFIQSRFSFCFCVLNEKSFVFGFRIKTTERKFTRWKTSMCLCLSNRITIVCHEKMYGNHCSLYNFKAPILPKHFEHIEKGTYIHFLFHFILESLFDQG